MSAKSEAEAIAKFVKAWGMTEEEMLRRVHAAGERITTLGLELADEGLPPSVVQLALITAGVSWAKRRGQLGTAKDDFDSAMREVVDG